ncbi:tyrosine-protein phosphatase [Conexibacter sp. CPCC 206217]|uniref:tyrosine-protein phosphatase n=1 Tax=Conexibacter sp. CPCC 206217 TaxID=3064574 RepID=UPI00271F455E|nr:CpsB/CapC family capsule biosynthesis tyrosine phosphatase [Conexibacter sp. CPCC 206217]MDO8210364.1 CpsB/CapC family capsule biosynthesis tyrosine phosphatase [Conexibacter sp. CPCC 206217]
MRVELHFHLLPGVDDGPTSVQESIELATLALADGTGTVVCTPHVRDVDVLSVPARVEELRAQLRTAGVPLQLEIGAEVAQDDVAGMSDAALEIAAHGPPGRRWILLEAPLSLDPAGLFDAVAEVRARGYAVLIGHPERCPSLMTGQGGRGLDELAAAGAPLLQVNGSSLTGRHGEQARRWALELARAGRVAVIASDAHRPSRGPVLSAAVAALTSAGFAPETVELMVAETPCSLLREGIPLFA